MPQEFADLDEASAALFRAFGNALRLHRQFMVKRLGETDLHPGQAACLGVLAHRDGIAQRELAEALHIAAPTLSRMLQSMEKTGLVERRDDESDQRLSRVHVTAAGRDVAREMRAAMAGHIPAVVAALSREERVELARLLDKLSASISRSLDAGAATGGRADGADDRADGAAP
ncbi:MAG: MarR family transcriptional regulator [Actinomycetota bacterium]|nr:MAG: MarR family transcriptional regulator [Actinomycetota bacterium]